MRKMWGHVSEQFWPVSHDDTVPRGGRERKEGRGSESENVNVVYEMK
jgi:hypothetical protein